MIVARIIWSMLAPSAVALSNLDQPSYRAIVEAVRRGEADEGPDGGHRAAFAKLADRTMRPLSTMTCQLAGSGGVACQTAGPVT